MAMPAVSFNYREHQEGRFLWNPRGKLMKECAKFALALSVVACTMGASARDGEVFV